MLMNQKIGRTAHQDIDRIFKKLLPKRGMAERDGQIALAHRMLNAMLTGGIGLSDAGTGIGKTYAYLAAGAVFLRACAAIGKKPRPILVSTSSIALQSAVRDEYLPFLSDVLMEDGMITRPLLAAIRKGKSHYVCDERLKLRLTQISTSKKNPAATAALRSLRKCLDADEAEHLSGYDRERICVPHACDCQKKKCRYQRFLEDCESDLYQFQICNHNLLMADAIHRRTGLKPILPFPSAVIMDEAHKLPEVARQMFGTALEAGSIQSLIETLRDERFVLASESLADLSAPLLDKMQRPFDEDARFTGFARLLALPVRSLLAIRDQLKGQLSPEGRRQLNAVASAALTLYEERPSMVRYVEQDDHGGTRLCATAFDLAAKLRSTLWGQSHPFLLTSGTLAVGRDFRRFKEETGLLIDSRVVESVSPSPFHYRKNCLLYLPHTPPRLDSERYFHELAEEIRQLLLASHGHGLVLFTSYAAMSAVKERLTELALPWPLMVMGRNAIHTTEAFRKHPGSVLMAAGAAWEGLDFSGDGVSMLIIPRLPFAHPDAIREKEREKYPTLRAFIQSVVTPEMQIKLRQGFGRAIRTETDTCAVAVLDERASRTGRYFREMRAALPDMPLTSSINDVERFIRRVKSRDYFNETPA